MRFYVTTKIVDKNINPVREAFTASVSRDDIPELVNNFIEEFNKHVNPADRRCLVSIEYEGDKDVKLFSEVEQTTSDSDEELADENVVYGPDGHVFEITKDWYTNNRGTVCQNLKCKHCEVTAKNKKIGDEMKFMYDEKYIAKKYHPCAGCCD